MSESEEREHIALHAQPVQMLGRINANQSQAKCAGLGMSAHDEGASFASSMCLPERLIGSI